MESVFEIIAEPNRRAILSLLVSSEQSVGEIERPLRMPQPTVSKHLRVLREAGFVEFTVDTQRRLFISMGAAGWHICLDVLDRHLSGTPIGRIAGPDAMKFIGWQRLNAEYEEQFGVETPEKESW